MRYFFAVAVIIFVIFSSREQNVFASTNEDLDLLTAVYQQNESCLILKNETDRAICRAAKEKDCDDLDLMGERSLALCRVYVQRQSCSTYLSDFPQDLLVCKALFEGLCEAYWGPQRRECENKYIPQGPLTIAENKWVKLYYLPSHRWTSYQTKWK